MVAPTRRRFSLDAVEAMHRERAKGSKLETIGRRFNISAAAAWYWIRQLPKLRNGVNNRTPPRRNAKEIDKRRDRVAKLAEKMVNGEPAHSSANAIAAALQRETRGKICISKSTSRRDLKSRLFNSRARRDTCTLPKDRAKRLAFARKYGNSNGLIFSDEKIFTTNNESYRQQWVRGETKPARRLKQRWPTARIMVWGAIGVGWHHFVVLPATRGRSAAADGRVLPYRLQKNDYIARCIKPVKDHLCKRGNIFQQDGAAAHTAAAVRKYLADSGICVAEGWPARSPDMSPIETLWANLQRQVTTRRPQIRRQLVLAFNWAVARLTRESVDRYARSWRRRAAAVIAAGGGVI